MLPLALTLGVAAMAVIFITVTARRATRELEFAISHTIHHHALIKERLRHLGIEFDEKFGVAPSTLEYRKGLKQ